jgi:ubiquinol-cytochrome c reductase cytochrome c1 subunit
MRKIIIAIMIAVLPGLALASEGGVHMQKVDIDLHNKETLQRGAKVFVNYCLSCHSAQYMRYNRMGSDLGLTDQEVKDNLMFAADKVGETMTIAMPSNKAEVWFGTAPPDLSVIARAKGKDYIYTYLTGFYVDDSRPTGVNNVALKNAAMPDVLWELEGLKAPIYKTEMHEGEEVKTIEGYKHLTKGKMTPAEFDAAARDLTAFLVYMGEPSQQTRKAYGFWVLLFLFGLFVVSYYLKKEYWKDVH